MRAFCLMGILVISACSAQTGGTPPSALASPASPTAASPCRLPVWWGDQGSNIHAGFVSVPGGAFSDAGILPVVVQPNQVGGAYGGTYDAATQRWLRVSRPAVSPDGTRYAYWTADPSHAEVHVVDTATGSDHVAYSGTVPFIIVGFESDAIYVAHIVNARQGAFDRLFRLDPAGGTPQLVPGSDRHMYQWGWVLTADGAAWGIDNHVTGSDYTYSVLRLDLATSEVTQWMEGPTGQLFWPLGVDAQHRLYAAPYNGPLWRISAPGQVTELASPSQVSFGSAIGGPSNFVADTKGVWISGQGSVWLYADGRDPKQFVVGASSDVTYPAGTCLS